jgi:hypothetical protein
VTPIKHTCLHIRRWHEEAYLATLCKNAEKANLSTATFVPCDQDSNRLSCLVARLKLRTSTVHITTDSQARFFPLPKVERVIIFTVTWRMSGRLRYIERMRNLKEGGEMITFVTDW